MEQLYKKNIIDCERFFNARNKSHESIIYIEPNVSKQQCLATALSTVRFLRKQNVPPVLQQSLTYLSAKSFLRKINEQTQE